MTTAATDTLLSRIFDNLTAIDVETAYNDMLDDCYSLESVGGPFSHMSASRVLKEVDPIAYRCGMNDYTDGEEYVEIDCDYYDKREVEKERDEFISELESELEELEEELEEADNEEERDGDQCDKLQNDIEAKRAEIAAVRDYSF